MIMMYCNFYSNTNGSIWNDVKSLLNIINLSKIKSVINKTVNKIKGCNDSIGKITCLIEGIIEIFD